MIDLINKQREPLRAESEQIDAEIKELDRKKRALGMRKAVVCGQLYTLNVLASEAKESGNTPQAEATEGSSKTAQEVRELLQSQPAFLQRLMERTSAIIAEDAAPSLLAADSTESQKGATEPPLAELIEAATRANEREMAEQERRPNAMTPGCFGPGMPFTLGSLVSSGALGPFPAWMMSDPSHLLGNLALMGMTPPAHLVVQVATQKMLSQTSARIAEDHALSLLRV